MDGKKGGSRMNSNSCLSKSDNRAESRPAGLTGNLLERTIVCGSYDDMSRKSAQFMADMLKKKPDALFSLSAGGTTIRTYEILKEMQDKGTVDFSKARFIQLDEWLDIADRSEDCNSFMHKHFFDPLGIKPGQIRAFNVQGDIDAECRALDEYVDSAGGIDFVLLGIGMNGHVALLEPGASFDSGFHAVDLSETTKSVGQKYFSNGMTLTRGLTIGGRQILAADTVLLQAGSPAKAQIVREMYNDDTGSRVPAAIMKQVRNGYVVLDQDAAALLDI